MSSLELDFPGESAYMIPAKNLGGGGPGGGSKENFGVVVNIFHEIFFKSWGLVKQIHKIPFFGQIFPYLALINLGVGEEG